MYCRKASLQPLTCHHLLHTLRAPRPYNRRRASVFCMSLRTSAHTGAAIRIPAVKLDKLALLRANSYTLFRVCLKYCFLSCPTAESTDCHVAPLLAMTCRNLQRVSGCKDALPGKPVTAYVFAQGAACFLLPLRGCGLPRRFAPRNDMQKFAACPRLQGRNDMQKFAACPRLQGRNDMQKTEARQRLQGGLAQ